MRGVKWEGRRRRALLKLKEDIESGKVDNDILWLLNIINSRKEYYTTSSCSGRIQVAVTELPGEKGVMRVIAKWHHPIKVSYLLLVLDSCTEENIWFAVHPPIIHVMCRDVDSAIKLLKIVRDNGFKHSGIQGVTPDRVAIEVAASDKIEAPLRLRGNEIVPRDRLGFLVEAANRVLLRGKRRLELLGEAFSKL